MLTLDDRVEHRVPSSMEADEVQPVADDLQRLESTRLIPIGATVIELIKRGSEPLLEASIHMEVATGPKSARCVIVAAARNAAERGLILARHVDVFWRAFR